MTILVDQYGRPIGAKQSKPLDPSKKTLVIFTPTIYQDYIAPAGALEEHPACHALFFYATRARNNVEQEKDTIKLEGDNSSDSDRFDYRQLFTSVAKIYGVEPEHMVHYWRNVDEQFRLLGLPLVPVGYRWDGKVEVKGRN